ncbi:MAG: hypothetical protein CTY33_05265 [Methylotenera sp.]|nr:MAG: hypothetical protein CTY33_05265 [Methylotenera sp.]
MDKRLNMLAKRRHLLLTQAAIQRELLMDELAPWQARLAMAEKGLSAVRYVKSHPTLLIGGLALFGLLRPGASLLGRGRAAKWLHTGLATVKIARKLYSMLPKKPLPPQVVK